MLFDRGIHAIEPVEETFSQTTEASPAPHPAAIPRRTRRTTASSPHPTEKAEAEVETAEEGREEQRAGLGRAPQLERSQLGSLESAAQGLAVEEGEVIAELERTVGQAPALAGEVVEVRHLDDGEAARREVSPNPLEGGDRSPEMLEHMDHRDQIKANSEVRGSLDVSAVNPVASRDRVGGRRRALDPLRSVPELAESVEEEPSVAADVERP